MHSPMTILCSSMDFEKQMVLRTKRLLCGRCFRAALKISHTAELVVGLLDCSDGARGHRYIRNRADPPDARRLEPPVDRTHRPLESSLDCPATLCLVLTQGGAEEWAIAHGGVEGAPANLTPCRRGKWHDHLLVETALATLTVVCHC